MCMARIIQYNHPEFCVAIAELMLSFEIFSVSQPLVLSLCTDSCHHHNFNHVIVIVIVTLHYVPLKLHPIFGFCHHDYLLGKGSEKKIRIFYGLLPNRGAGGSATVVKKPYCFFEKKYFFRELIESF